MKLNPKNMLRKNSIYLFPFLVAVFIILISLNVLVPSVQTIIETEQNLSNKTEDLKKLQKKRQLLESIDKSQLVARLRDAEIALPQDKDVASILTALETVSGSSSETIDGVRLAPGLVSSASATATKDKSKTPGEVVSLKGASAVTVTVNTRGETEQLISFMKTLENSRRIMDMKTVAISFLPDQPGFSTTDFTMLAYFLPGITTIGALDSPVIELTDAERNVIEKVATLPIVSISQGSGALGTEPVGKTDLFSL